MILKVKRKAYETNYDCWVFDEISYIKYRNDAKRDSISRELPGSDFKVITSLTCTTKELYVRIVLQYMDSNRRPTVLYLQNCTCYLCSNEGKTFDKINC